MILPKLIHKAAEAAANEIGGDTKKISATITSHLKKVLNGQQHEHIFEILQCQDLIPEELCGSAPCSLPLGVRIVALRERHKKALAKIKAMETEANSIYLPW